MDKDNNELATLGGGCFWCLEAIYLRINGVIDVASGYSGGNKNKPTTDEVYAGDTGHAEVVQLTFNPDIISYREILEIFFTMHDPTTLNRQGNDVGEWYRSAIFYHTDNQRHIAEEVMADFASDLWPDPVVTELTRFTKFWPAGPEHQKFYEKNPQYGYCQVIIDPKIVKLRREFVSKFKT
jgi:peptide-methionine (S)-S-oxide reductase